MLVYVYICVSLCVYTSQYVYIYIYTPVEIFANMCVCICNKTCRYLPMGVHICEYVCTSVTICGITRPTSVYLCIDMCRYVYIYVTAFVNMCRHVSI